MFAKFKQNYALISLLIFTALTRLWRLSFPPLPYFDEVYHLPTIKLILENSPRAFEWWHQAYDGVHFFDWLHPPLAKYLAAGALAILGDFQVGPLQNLLWIARLPSALAGIVLVWLVYQLGYELFLQKNSQKFAKRVGLLAALLVSLDGLVLVQSRIVMNDIIVTTWLVASLLFFHRWLKCDQVKPLFFTGLFLGLGLATKWSAVFGLLLVWAVTIFKKKVSWQGLFSLVLMPGLIYLAAYLPMFLQGKSWSDFFKLHQQIVWYQTHRDRKHAYQSRPWQWWLNLRPVWYWTAKEDQLTGVSQATGPSKATTVEKAEANIQANIYALANPVLSWLGVMAVAWWLGSLVLSWVVRDWQLSQQSNRQVNRRLKIKQAKLNFLGLFYLSLWLPWIFSPRIMFFYHYLPAIPWLCLITAYFLLKKVKPWSKLVFTLSLAAVCLAFVCFYPRWTGLPVTSRFLNKLYLAIPSWK